MSKVGQWKVTVVTKTYRERDAVVASILWKKVNPFLNSVTFSCKGEVGTETESKLPKEAEHFTMPEGAGEELIQTGDKFVDLVITKYDGIVAENSGTKGECTLGNRGHAHIV